MRDVVIPYKRSRSDEIVYALRSLKNIKHGDVWVIGDHPKLKVKHIPLIQSIDVALNTYRALGLAVNNPDISDEFIFMHDDMFIMKPIEDIPVHHRGYYRDVIGKYQGKHIRNYYTRRMQKTYQVLQKLGIDDPLCYELHIPFVISKSKWKKVAQYITPELNKLSMYGNLCSIGGTKIKDVKVRTKDWIPQGAFASSHDTTFRTNSLGKLVRELFPDMSEYEK